MRHHARSQVGWLADLGQRALDLGDGRIPAVPLVEVG
jgi:hypothetical protein